MPTFMLTAGAPVPLPRRPLQIRVRSGKGEPFALEVRADPGSGTKSVQPQPGLVVLPVVGGPAVVVVRSATGMPFPADMEVAVDVTAGTVQSADPDRAVLAQVRLGGLTERELVAVSAAEDRLLVRAAGVSAEGEEQQLGPLGNAARAATSGLLGVPLLDADQTLHIVAAVDASASFRHRLGDGTVGALLDVLAGIASVVGHGCRTGGAVVGPDVQWIDVHAPDRLAAVLPPAVEAQPLRSGFRSSARALAGFAPDRNTQVYLLTDGVPGDLQALEREAEVPGQARHLVAVCPSGVWAASRRTAVPATVVEPSRDLASQLLARPGELRALVRNLLQGCFVPGTTAYERVA